MYHLWTRAHRPAFFEDALKAVGLDNMEGRVKCSDQEIKNRIGEQRAEDKDEEHLRQIQTQRQRQNMLRDRQVVEDQRHRSEQWVRSLLGVRDAPPLDCSCPIEKRYGLGTRRTISEFEDTIGVCFFTLSVREHSPPVGYRFTGDDITDALNALSLSLTEIDDDTKESDAVDITTYDAHVDLTSSNSTLDALNLVRAYLRSNR